jgi:pilus assembly protein Flp/PilA
MRAIISRFKQSKAGVTAIEYGLIASLIAIAAIAAMTALGTALQNQFGAVVAAL